MNIIWKQGLSYQENYDNLLEKLSEDSKEWNTSEPPQDGSILYFKCADTSYNNEFDIGYWQDYTQREDYLKGWLELEGEWNTEFGNCVEIIGWKYVGEFK